MQALPELTFTEVLPRLVLAAVLGGLIGFERRLHHKAIGVAGMVLVATGSGAYMYLARHLAVTDPAALGRAEQGLLQGIGFLGGAVIFKGGTDVRGIKTAAAIWITGAIGMTIATDAWRLGILMGVATALILFLADISGGAMRQVDEAVEVQKTAQGGASEQGAYERPKKQ